MKYPIEPFPLDLKCLILKCKQYNFIIEFPLNLEHFEIYSDDYSHGLATVPDSVLVLGISYTCIKDVEKVPKKCKLVGYKDCPDKLYRNIMGRKFKVNLVKHYLSEKMRDLKINNCCLCLGF